MTTFTKLLPPEAAPAQPILARAKQLVLTSAQRMAWEDSFETPEGVIAVSVEEKRPLFVNDVFVDDAGQFWVVRPAVEKVLHVTGDLRTMQEAVGALINRGVEVAEAPEGFAVRPLPNIAKMLGMIGLEVTEVEEAFDPSASSVMQAAAAVAAVAAAAVIITITAKRNAAVAAAGTTTTRKSAAAAVAAITTIMPKRNAAAVAAVMTITTRKRVVAAVANIITMKMSAVAASTTIIMTVKSIITIITRKAPAAAVAVTSTDL